MSTYHPLIGTVNDNGIEYVTKTHGKNTFNYLNFKDNILKSTVPIQYKEGFYISGIKYSYTFDKNESILKNKFIYKIEDKIKEQLSLKFYLNKDEADFNLQIEAFNKIENNKVISVDEYINNNNSILPYIYTMVHINYLNNIIPEKK
jgi:hypothetical protein